MASDGAQAVRAAFTHPAMTVGYCHTCEFFVPISCALPGKTEQGALVTYVTGKKQVRAQRAVRGFQPSPGLR